MNRVMTASIVFMTFILLALASLAEAQPQSFARSNCCHLLISQVLDQKGHLPGGHKPPTPSVSDHGPALVNGVKAGPPAQETTIYTKIVPVLRTLLGPILIGVAAAMLIHIELTSQDSRKFERLVLWPFVLIFGLVLIRHFDDIWHFLFSNFI